MKKRNIQQRRWSARTQTVHRDNHRQTNVLGTAEVHAHHLKPSHLEIVTFTASRSMGRFSLRTDSSGGSRTGACGFSPCMSEPGGLCLSPWTNTGSVGGDGPDMAGLSGPCCETSLCLVQCSVTTSSSWCRFGSDALSACFRSRTPGSPLPGTTSRTSRWAGDDRSTRIGRGHCAPSMIG
jgi:hypothetical protein